MIYEEIVFVERLELYILYIYSYKYIYICMFIYVCFVPSVELLLGKLPHFEGDLVTLTVEKREAQRK